MIPQRLKLASHGSSNNIHRFALLFLVCSSSTASGRGRGGFTIDLIHRDSPRSPFYNSSETSCQRLKNAFRRSMDRLSHFNPTTGASSSVADQLDLPESTIIGNNGEYLMELSIGTPPFPIKAIADTGSDLIWTQCKPCNNCYQQTDPLFDPSKSSTYRTIPCSSNQCNTLQGNCSSQDSTCQYGVGYVDGSHTIGDYAADTVTLASTTGGSVSFPNTLIGCGHDNTGTFDRKGSGIVGLGGGDKSLISQLATSIDGKFSYCLIPFASQGDQTSKLSFGDNAVVSGSGLVSTPLVQRQPRKTYFFLTLEAISVDDTKVAFISSSSSASGEGNIIIDSGSTYTILQQPFYSDLEGAVDKVVGRERVRDPRFPTPLCYKASEDFKFPNITVHFSDADVKLEPKNTFVNSFAGELTAVCFAFIPFNRPLSIYGNLAQSDFLVGYDLKGKTVSFKPTDCTNF